MLKFFFIFSYSATLDSIIKGLFFSPSLFAVRLAPLAHSPLYFCAGLLAEMGWQWGSRRTATEEVSFFRTFFGSAWVCLCVYT